MKISKIEINAFGGLKNFTLEPGDGFNLIFGENENGKTTVMVFIRCMFYGTGNKKQNLRESIREKYTPWDGSTMGGRIYFECGGVNYCLEREFKGSDSSDRIVLTDKDSGRTLPADSRVGEKLFMLTEAAFVRSVYIDNGVYFTDDASARADLNTRLSNTAVSGEDGISQQKTEKRLTEAKNKILSTSGRAGSLVADRKALEELKARYDRALEAQKQMSEIAENAQKAQADIEGLQAEYEKDKKIIDSENDVKNARRLADYVELKEKLDRLNEKLTAADGSVLRQDFTGVSGIWLAKYEKQTGEAEALRAQAKAQKAAFESAQKMTPAEAENQLGAVKAKTEELRKRLNSTAEEIAEKDKELAALEADIKEAKNRKKSFNPYLFAAGLVFGVIAAVIEITLSNVIFSVIAASAAAICLICSLFLRPAVKTDELEQKKAAAEREKEMLLNSKEETSAALETNRAGMEQMQKVIETQATLSKHQLEDIAQKERLADEQSVAAEVTLRELTAHFAKWKPVNGIDEIKKELEELKALFEERKELQIKLNVYVKDFGEMTAEEAKERLGKISVGGAEPDGEDFEARKEKLEKLQNFITAKREEKASLEATLSNGFPGFVNPQTIMRDIHELEETIRSKEEFYSAAALAIEVLSDSAAGMRKSYGAALETKALEIFGRLTGGKYGMLSVDDNLKMSAEETGVFGTKSIDYLSRGTEDQAYLSLRLAISKLLSGEESLPVMLDDALSQFDDVRLRAAVKFLSEYSAENQTLLFTCHNAVRDLAEQSGAKVINAF